MAWNEIDHYRYAWHDWTRPGDLVIVPVRGPVLRIEPIFDHGDLATEHILGALHPRLRGARYVAPFTLAEDAPVLGVRRLVYPDIAQVELAALGREVIAVVHARGGETSSGRGRWAQLEVGEVANVWMWLELRVEHGVTITSDLEQFLPSMPSELAETIAANRGLPTLGGHPPPRRRMMDPTLMTPARLRPQGSRPGRRAEVGRVGDRDCWSASSRNSGATTIGPSAPADATARLSAYRSAQDTAGADARTCDIATDVPVHRETVPTVVSPGGWR